MSIMQNTILMSIPMFIFMGIILQKLDLLKTIRINGILFGEVRGGVAISTVLVGTLLALQQVLLVLQLLQWVLFHYLL